MIATRNWTITDTCITVVRIVMSVYVLRIDAAAIISGIATAGSVPKMNRSTISAPTPPMAISRPRLEPWSEPEAS